MFAHYNGMANWIFIFGLLSALGSGLIAGTFFAFSTFVMRSLGRVPSNEGIAAMQSINIVVINSWFMTVFVGTAVTSIVLAVVSLFRWAESGSGYSLAGCLLYVVGTFLVTIFFNVPLNDALASVDPQSAQGADVWTNYLSRWTIWNHVRTAAALAAMTCLIFGLVYRQTRL